MSRPFYDAVLLIAFGGPAAPEEIRPFLARVVKGIPVPPDRLEEVVRHYEAVGGKSPLNEITARQAAALEAALNNRGFPLPVYVGLRNAEPFFSDALNAMAAAGVRKVLGFILSAHRTDASWDRYQRNIEEAALEVGTEAPEVEYCPGWHDHPLFIQSWAERIGDCLAVLPLNKARKAPLVFTAHSLPAAMASRSPYVEQVERSARLVAARLGHERWSVAYQSRSGNPNDPWLEPDINDVLRTLARQGATEAVIAPIGFVCDHVEVLYDLDIEAARTAAEGGLRVLRVSCPNDHPTFVRMMAEIVTAAAAPVPE
jgi:ferrochelatase